MIPFAHRLIPVVLPNLAHHAPMIQAAALKTNQALLDVIQSLPSPSHFPAQQIQSIEKESVCSSTAGQSTPSTSPVPSRQSTGSKELTSPSVAKEATTAADLPDFTMSPASDRTTVPTARRNAVSVSTATPSDSTGTDAINASHPLGRIISPAPQVTLESIYHDTINLTCCFLFIRRKIFLTIRHR